MLNSVVAVASLGFALAVSADSGYLASGPTELRFLPPTPSVPRAFLAAIAAQPIAPANVSTNAEALAPVPNLPGPLNTNTVVTTAKSPDPVVQTPQVAPVVGTQSQDDTVSPQMLVPFFNNNNNRGRKGSDAGVIMPLNFAPPQTIAPVSSKATYTNAP